MEIRKILFVTKFEELSLEALNALMILRQAALTHVVFITVIERERVAMRRGTGYQKAEEIKLRETANIRFIDWAEPLFEQGMEVGVYITVGNLVGEVIKASGKEAADLIVIGASPKGRIEQLYSGSEITDRHRRLTERADRAALFRIRDHRARPQVLRSRHGLSGDGGKRRDPGKPLCQAPACHGLVAGQSSGRRRPGGHGRHGGRGERGSRGRRKAAFRLLGHGNPETAKGHPETTGRCLRPLGGTGHPDPPPRLRRRSGEGDRESGAGMSGDPDRDGLVFATRPVRALAGQHARQDRTAVDGSHTAGPAGNPAAIEPRHIEAAGRTGKTNQEDPMAVITISRQFGAGGKTLGAMLAKELGYTFADSNIIQNIAKEANVSLEWVRAFEKEAGSRVSRLISGMVSKRLVDRILKDERGYLDEQIYLDYLVLIIARIADEGDVVVLGRGSQYILNDHPEAVHVLLINTPEQRVRFIMEHYDMNERRASQWVAAEERRRATLYGRLGKTDYDNPALYHLAVNTSRVSLEAARKMICDYVRG
jgi:cytidylate kinase